MQTAIVIGVGPQEGLGARLCERFASLGLHVFVAGRTQENLDSVVDAIQTNGGDATAVVTDATDESQVEALFERAAAEGPGHLDLAVYNAGNNTPGRIIDMEAEFFEQSWRVCTYGGFLFGREAVRHMTANNQGGTLLFTGASASLRGRANFGAFNSSKGALRNLAMAMAKEYAEREAALDAAKRDAAAKADEAALRADEARRAADALKEAKQQSAAAGAAAANAPSAPSVSEASSALESARSEIADLEAKLLAAESAARDAKAARRSAAARTRPSSASSRLTWASINTRKSTLSTS